MKSRNLAPQVELHNNTHPCGLRTSEQAPAMYGYATYSYKKGAFIYRVEGVISDLSESGCSIRGTTPQLVGMSMRVILYFNDKQPPLCVSGATVSWLSGESFGLKFPQLKPNDVVRLKERTRAR